MQTAVRVPHRGYALLCIVTMLMLAFAGRPAHARSAQHAQAQPADVTAEAGAPVPDSQPLPHLTLTLKRSAAQQADLDGFLRTVQLPGKGSYHHWLTTAQFAARFAPATEQAEAARQWLISQGFQVGSISPDGMRIKFSGTSAQVNRAFHTTLRMQSNGASSAPVAENAAKLAEPVALSQVVAAVTGTDLLQASDSNAMSALSGAVESNTAAAVALSAADAGQEDLSDLLQQAAAQGITVIFQDGNPSLSTLSLRTNATDTNAAALADAAARPDWQAAPGLPADQLRAVPDAVYPDPAAFAVALQKFAQTHGRVGEIAQVLYQLRTGHQIFQHTDPGTPEGSWSAVDGLGTINLPALLNALAAGTQGGNVALAVSSNSITHGQNLSLTLTVTGSGTTPTGTVTAMLKGRSNGAVMMLGPLVLANGLATASTSSLPGDIYDISATYSGDGAYAAATSNTQTTTVSPEAATVTASVPNTATPLGTSIPVTVIVTLPSGIGTPSGTVSVTPFGFNPSTPITATLQPSGVATGSAVVNVPLQGVGSFTFQANCASNASFSCSTPVSLAVNVAKGVPVVALAATPSNTSTAGGNQYDLAVTVAPPTGSTGLASPAGTVNVTDNGTKIAAVTLASGAGTAQVTLSGINHSLVAVYSGDSNYVTASSTASALAGALIPTTTTLTTSVFNGPFGIGVPLTATVTPTSYAASGAPTGTITYTSSLQGVVGTATLGNGFVTLNVTSLIAGVHNISASYKPDNSVYAASSSASGVSVTITAVKQPTTTTLTVAPSTPLAAQPVVLTATIALAPTATGGTTATSTFTGTVRFFSNKVYIGQASVVNNAATLTTKFVSSTPVSLSASYNGDPNFYGSTSTPLLIAPVRSAPGLTLNVTSTTPNTGSFVSLTTTLAPGDSTITAVPTGTVTFFDNRNGTANMLGVAALGLNATNSSSIVTLLQNALGGGSHSFTAVYSGDTNFLPATSSEAVLNLGDFTVAFSPSSLNLTRGSSAAVVAALTPLNGFSGFVSLSCVPPSGSNITCSFNPASITAGGQATLTIQTIAGTAKLKASGAGPEHTMQPWRRYAAGTAAPIAVAGLLLFAVPRRRRHMLAALALIFAVGLVSGGCGVGIVGTTNNTDGGGSTTVTGGSTGSSTGTPLGTALLSITAASGDNTLRHVYSYQVTVQ